MTITQDAIVRALVDHAREPILEHFRADSCIASTRIGLDVLKYFGVHAVPLPLAILIFNEEAVQMLEDGMTMDDLAQFMRDIPSSRQGGPWSMGLGLGGDPEPGKWAGHLVIARPLLNQMIDLSVDQATRLHKGLDFDGPVLWHCDDQEWWAGQRTLTDPLIYVNDKNNRRILVMFDIEDRHGELQKYKLSSNWHRRSGGSSEPFRIVTAEIIRRIKEDLHDH